MSLDKSTSTPLKYAIKFGPILGFGIFFWQNPTSKRPPPYTVQGVPSGPGQPLVDIGIRVVL